jgi:hypothetical protein
MSDGTKYRVMGVADGSLRLGFASLTPEEWTQAVSLLKQALQTLYPSTPADAIPTHSSVKIVHEPVTLQRVLLP